MDFIYKREDAFTLSFALKDVIASMYVKSVWVYVDPASSSNKKHEAFIGSRYSRVYPYLFGFL
jgi:hypothetical protein